jgi:hypothetical protein
MGFSQYINGFALVAYKIFQQAALCRSAGDKTACNAGMIEEKNGVLF